MQGAILKPFYEGRYEPVFGCNTKQWWAYDRETREFCDPPTFVLNLIKTVCGKDSDKAESFFQQLLDKNPSWLYDKGFRWEEDLEI